MATTRKKIRDPRGPLLADLKRWCDARAKARRSVEGLTLKIWSATYAYCEACIAHGGAQGTTAAIQKLAASLRKSHVTVAYWYYHGKFMREHKLDSPKLTSEGVREAYAAHGCLEPASMVKVLHVLRTDGTRAAVRHVLSRSEAYRIRQEARRVFRMEQRNVLNETTLKMEMLAWQTFAEAYYGHEVAVSIEDPETGDDLARVGD